jgi:hypothetical protein
MTAPPVVVTLLFVVAGLLPIDLLLQMSNWAHSRFEHPSITAEFAGPGTSEADIQAEFFPWQLDENPPIRKQVVRVELRAIPEMTPPPEAPVRRGPLIDESALVA